MRLTAPIYSSTALATRQREIKDIADTQVVHITENGNGAYIFCSESVFENELKQAMAKARYEAEMEFIINRGAKDIQEGRYTTDVDSFVNKVRGQRALDD